MRLNTETHGGHRWMVHLLRGSAAVLSGLLLWNAFAGQARPESGWFALVPLILVVRHNRPRVAARCAFAAGVVYWILTLSWFPAIIKNGGPWPLVFLGLVGLSLWCALFMALYAYGSARVWDWAGGDSGWRRIVAVALLDPLCWVGTELIRAHLFSGFAWNFLGVSQVENLALVQVSAVAGVYGVSALLVMANGAIATMLERGIGPLIARISYGMGDTRSYAIGVRGRFKERLGRTVESVVPLALIVLCWIWGVQRIAQWRQLEARSPLWRVALIQPDSPCVFILNEEVVQQQVTRLVDQTRLAGAARPDLVIWPETAVLGSVPYEPETMKLIRKGAAAAGAPLLTGTLEMEHVEISRAAPDGMAFYNGAWLFSEQGRKLGFYRKQHLVPFGEYIPGDKVLPWLQGLAPTGVSCTPGVDPGVMKVVRAGEASEELHLAPLICFEDTVAGLSRSAVRAGARMLALLTNDAWFSGSAEPMQHLRQSVFRAVENGVPLVRAANSGVSGLVDPVGRVTWLESQGRTTDFDGFMVVPVAVPVEPLPSPYTRYGDWMLAYPGALLVVVLWLTTWYVREEGGASR